MRCGRPSAAKNCCMRSICERRYENFSSLRRSPKHNATLFWHLGTYTKCWKTWIAKIFIWLLVKPYKIKKEVTGSNCISILLWLPQKQKQRICGYLISLQYGILQASFLQSKAWCHSAEDVVMSSIQLSTLSFTLFFQLLLNKLDTGWVIMMPIVLKYITNRKFILFLCWFSFHILNWRN